MEVFSTTEIVSHIYDYLYDENSEDCTNFICVMSKTHHYMIGDYSDITKCEHTNVKHITITNMKNIHKYTNAISMTIDIPSSKKRSKIFTYKEYDIPSNILSLHVRSIDSQTLLKYPPYLSDCRFGEKNTTMNIKQLAQTNVHKLHISTLQDYISDLSVKELLVDNYGSIKSIGSFPTFSHSIVYLYIEWPNNIPFGYTIERESGITHCSLLPPCLETLIISNEYKHDLKYEFFPITLTTFNLQEKYNKSLGQSMLPKNLKELDMWGYDKLFLENTLPNSLETLIMCGTRKTMLSRLPDSLTCLDLSNCSFDNTIIMPPNIKILECSKEMKLDMFPHTLNELITSNQFNTVITDMTFGNNLTSLTLNDGFDTDIPENVLPNSLTYLNIGNLFDKELGPNVIPKSVLTFILGDAFDSIIHPDALPQLEKLKIGDKYNKSCENFPTSLTELSLGKMFNQTLDLAKFPKLRILRLNDNYTQMLTYVPDSLHFLSISEQHYIYLAPLLCERDMIVEYKKIDSGQSFYVEYKNNKCRKYYNLAYDTYKPKKKKQYVSDDDVSDDEKQSTKSKKNKKRDESDDDDAVSIEEKNYDMDDDAVHIEEKTNRKMSVDYSDTNHNTILRELERENDRRDAVMEEFGQDTQDGNVTDIASQDSDELY